MQKEEDERLRKLEEERAERLELINKEIRENNFRRAILDESNNAFEGKFEILLKSFSFFYENPSQIIN